MSVSTASLRRHAHLRAGAALLCLFGCAHTPTIVLETEHATTLLVQQPALYPETIEYDRVRDEFLVGSFREGAIYTIDQHGAARKLVDDPRLCSVLGIALDPARDRVWAVNSDLGASAKPSTPGPKHLATVGVYDRASGKALSYVDLAPLAGGEHLLNGIALDAAGNAYVTDSFSPNIYRITGDGVASLFVHDAQFAGEGINLNGLVVHPDGYLLVIKKSDGKLFKVPLENPSAFHQVRLDHAFVGGDGLLLIGARSLIVVANQVPGSASNSAFSIASDDGWATAKQRSTHALGDVYPTTAVLRKDTIYVIHTQLNRLIQAAPEEKPQLRARAKIQAIGRVID
jgi:hypothetical protein